MFNHRYQIRPAFYLDPSALRRRFFVCGLVQLACMPFLLVFLSLHFALQNIYHWKSTKQYLGPREWSLSAQWTFREFNELPHNFDRRMIPSYKSADHYLSLFGANDVFVALGRILVFIGGSFGVVLVAFAAINDAILLHVKIADWNLLWYLGIVGAVYSMGKSMLPTNLVDTGPSSSRNMFSECEAALSDVEKSTHYFPSNWRGRGWDKSTFTEFSTLYRVKAHLFAMELASLVLAPYILCVSLPKNAESICEFVLSTRVEVPGAGDMCGFATFDFDLFGDEARTSSSKAQVDLATGSLSQSVLHFGNVDRATIGIPKPRAWEGKMEKSFFSFKVK
jgi:autophagy-related protein 9